MSEEKDVLDYEFECMDLDTRVTIREYFKALLETLWREGEGFSGKRPLGNSGWQYEIYAALIRGGFVKGTLDVDGYVEKLDEKKADKFIIERIISRL